MSKSNAAAARALRRMKMTAAAVATDLAGNKASKTQSATLTAPRVRR